MSGQTFSGVRTSIRDDSSMDDAFRRITDKLVEVVAADVEREVPAAQLAVGFEGRIVWSAALGNAEDDTRFCLQCAGKPLVLSAIWRLIGDRRLELDAPVASYIPEFGANGKDRITVRNLLLETPGLPNQAADSPWNQYINVFEIQNRELLRSRFSEWVPEFAPGKRLGFYQTCMYMVFAELIRVVSGMEYTDFVETAVSRPLGLGRCLGIPVDDQHNIADTMQVVGTGADGRPIMTDADIVSNHPQWRALGCPAAGSFMSASQLALFYQALLHNPGQLWEPEILAAGTRRQQTFVDERNGTPLARTLGMYLAGDAAARRYDLGFALGHSPDAFGIAGLIVQVGWADPATGISFAFLNNAGFSHDCVARRGVGITRLASQLRPPA